MASVRLTRDVRSTIVNKLIRYRFNDRKAALDKNGERLLLLMRDRTIDSTQRKLFESVPDHWFPKTNNAMVRYAGYDIRVYAGSDSYITIPSSLNRHGHWLVLDQGDPLGMQIEMWDTERRNLDIESRQCRAEALAILNKVTTVKRLLEVWPEVKPFLPEAIKNDTPSLPAIQINVLNQKLGLPVPEDKVA